MPDQPLKAPDSPAGNRRRLLEERAAEAERKPKRSAKHRQAKPKNKSFSYGKRAA